MVDLIFGHSELVQVSEVRDGKLWLGGYSIDYDRNGVETGRSEVSWNCRLSRESTSDADSASHNTSKGEA